MPGVYLDRTIACSGLDDPVMAKRPRDILLSTLANRPRPLSIDELEAGLLSLDDAGLDRMAFWDEHIHPFKQTVLIAIRDTSAALLTPNLPVAWRTELEAQIKELTAHLELANRYVAVRTDEGSDGAIASPISRMMN